MFSIRHWKWWNWLLAAILMPLLAGGLGLTIYIGLAVIALIARVLFGPAPSWDPELDAPLFQMRGKEVDDDDDSWADEFWREEDERFYQEFSSRHLHHDW